MIVASMILSGYCKITAFRGTPRNEFDNYSSRTRFVGRPN